MSSEDDTFKKLSRCTFLELETKLATDLYWPGLIQFLEDNHWTYDDFKVEWRKRGNTYESL